MVVEAVEVHMRTQFHSAKCKRFMSYQRCSRFRTSRNREYLGNGSISRQAENGVISYHFPTLTKTIWWTLVQ